MKKKILSLFLSLAMAAGVVLVPNGGLIFKSSAATSGDYEYRVLSDGTAEISKYTGAGGNIIIPSSLDGRRVTSIGDYAFYGCASLESITIPDSVRNIGGGAFAGCEGLESVKIPDGVTSISKSVFNRCENLKSIIIPDSVTNIDDYAFSGCKNLISIVIPDGVTSIGGATFWGCENIRLIIIPGGVKSIGDYAFYGCKNLKSITGFSDYAKKYAEENFYGYNTLSKRDYSWDYLPELYVDTNLSENSATLTWGAVPGEEYEIFRYNSTTKKYAKIASKKGSAASHTITGLKPGTFYKFRVRAYMSYNGDKYASDYAEISVRTLDAPSKIKSRNDKIDKGYTASVTSKTVKISDKNIYTTANTTSNWARVSPLTQFVDKDGNPGFAYEDGDYIKIAKLDKNQKLTSTLKIKKKYPLFGGLVSDAKGNYYIVWGQHDENEKKTVVTLAVSKYNGDGKYVKTTTYRGGDLNTKLPFRSGNCAIALKGDVLVVSYARQMYKSSDGKNHQSNGVIAVNISSMENNQNYASYTSHSFDQRVMFDKAGTVWFADHGDAYPRGFTISAERESFNFVPFHFYLDASDISDMGIVNRTNAQLGGMVETSTGIVLVGASVKGMTKSTYEKQSRNLFVVYADPELKMPGGKSRTGDCNGAKVTDTGIRWLTDYGTNYEAREPQVVYTNNDRIVVMWEKHNRKTGKFAQSYYMVLSSNGAVLQKATPMNKIRLNACEEPIYANGRIYWVTADGGNAKIHELKIGELVRKKK